MIIIIGGIVVFISTIGGFMIAGGNPMALLHISEFVIIGGIALGVVLIATPNSVIKAMIVDIKGALGGHGGTAEEYEDLLKMLYEIFMLARRNGLISLDDHISDPPASSILSKYESFVQDEEKVEFLVNALRPIIDGRIKPEQLNGLLQSEIKAKEAQSHGPVNTLLFVGDSLPGIGICAAVLGIINTMAAISAGPEKVGQKVAAALTGTFLGIYGAYGFINPLAKRISENHRVHFKYFNMMSEAISGFANGLAPLMAIESVRRTMDGEVQPKADELEETLKNIGK